MARARPVRRSIETKSDQHSARALASNDFHTRNEGVRALSSWLATSSELSRPDLLLLWKGLFFAFWHSDQAPVQAELALRLASLAGGASDEVVLLYYDSFVATMQREWSGIDKHRLDKFMMLVRKFVTQLFSYVVTRPGDAVCQGCWKNILLQLLVNNNDPAAAGLSYHSADILYEAALDSSAGEPVTKVVLGFLLDVTCETVRLSNKPLLQARIRSGVFDKMLQHLEDWPSTDSAVLMHLDSSQLGSHLFELGAQPDTPGKSRKLFYELSRAFGAVQTTNQQASRTSAHTAAAIPSSATNISPIPQANGRHSQPLTSLTAEVKAPISSRKKKRKVNHPAESASAGPQIGELAEQPLASPAIAASSHVASPPDTADAPATYPPSQAQGPAQPSFLKPDHRVSPTASAPHTDQDSGNRHSKKHVKKRKHADRVIAAQGPYQSPVHSRETLTPASTPGAADHTPMQLVTGLSVAVPFTEGPSVKPLRSALKQTRSAQMGLSVGGHTLRPVPKTVRFALKRNIVFGKEASSAVKPRLISSAPPKQRPVRPSVVS